MTIKKTFNLAMARYPQGMPLTATFHFELDIQASKESVLQCGHVALSAAREIQEQGYCCFHWQCGKNRPAASVLVAASSGKSTDEYSQVFYYSFLQKGRC